MENSKYPKFKSPTLKQSLCEIRYNALSDDTVKRIPSSLVSLLAEEYPLFEILDESPFTFNIGGNIITDLIHRYKFSSDKHNYLVTVKKDAFSFTLEHDKNHSYDREEFYKKLCLEWERIAEKLKINNITRIGVRFVNFLEVEVSESNGKYFKEDSPYIPTIVLKSSKTFINRNDFQIYDDYNKLIVITLSQPSRDKKGKKELILDIDRIIENTDMIKSDVREKVRMLHSDIENVFFSSITENYKNLMQPEE